MNRATPIVIVLVIIVAVVIGYLVSRTGTEEPDTGARIAVVANTTTGTFWELIHKGAEKAVEGTDYKISWAGPESPNDVKGQAEIVDSFVEKGVVGMVISPIEIAALSPSITKVADANIPCALICARDQEYAGLCRMGPDEYIAGVSAARRLGDALNKKGRIAILKYLPDTMSPTKCENGFLDTIKNEYSDIQVVSQVYGEQVSEKALTATRELLMRNPSIDGLFASEESTSVGLLKALQDQGHAGKVKMVGCGTDQVLIDGLKSGAVTALISRNPYKMGYESVKAVIAALEGTEVEKRIDTGLKVITKENLDKPDIQAVINPEP